MSNMMRYQYMTQLCGCWNCSLEADDEQIFESLWYVFGVRVVMILGSDIFWRIVVMRMEMGGVKGPDCV